ncbi:hypothetical protein BVX98_02945 [bacterium F11]|nr:hypothetical protein BVX98_02945 [bacterium F11]
MNKSRPRKSQSRRFLLVRAFVVFLFVVLGARLVYVQGIQRSMLKKRANRQIPAKGERAPFRYSILDRNGFSLAETIQTASCYVDPKMIKDSNRVAYELSRILDLDSSHLLSRIQKASGSFLWIKRNIPADLVDKIKAKKLSGVDFKIEDRRHYPFGVVSSHLLGLVGIDGTGLSGIEQRYDKKLRSKESPSGHVQLTIDGLIQQVAERELDWGAKKTKSKKGMVVIQDPWTGHILAMASWPPLSLNPDDPPPSKELRIPPITDVFEPGSTFKVVVAAAIVEEKLVKEGEIFNGENGAWPVSSITIHDHEARDKMSFEDIFVYSSNIGTAKLGDRLGTKRMYQYARSFGFGVYPGSNLPGEVKGMLRPPVRWSGISKNVISFGQEVGVTALQMAGAYSAIANGGLLMEPRIVKAIVSRNNESTLWESEPASVRRVISKDTSEQLKKLLIEAVRKGTGQNARIHWRHDFVVAGKTGTAQKFDSAKNQYCNDLTLVSFCGFFPAGKPKLTMVVILDEPSGRSWGGVDAAPIFRRIAEQLSAQILM